MSPLPAEQGLFSARTIGVAAALATAFVSAINGPLFKPLLEGGWSVGAATLLRLVGASLVLSPWLIIAIVRTPRFLVRHWTLLVGLGLAGVSGSQLFYLAAIQRMPVGVALLIMYLAPVMLVGWVWISTRRSPSPLVIAGTILAVAGLVLAADLSGAKFDLLGVGLALASAACLAAYFVIAEKRGDSIPPLALAAGGLLVGTVFTGMLCTVGLLRFEAPPITVDFGPVTVPSFVVIACVACLTTPAGYGLGVTSVPLTGARLASFIGLTEVLFAVLFAWILLAETPTLVQAMGGALILSGVILVRAETTSPGNPRGEAGIVPIVPGQ